MELDLFSSNQCHIVKDHQHKQDSCTFTSLYRKYGCSLNNHFSLGCISQLNIDKVKLGDIRNTLSRYLCKFSC